MADDDFTQDDGAGAEGASLETPADASGSGAAAAEPATARATVQKQAFDTAGRARLRQFIARIERLEEDKAAVATDLKGVFAEAKGVGFDTKIIRLIVRLRKMDADERADQSALLDLYLSALGDDAPAPGRGDAAKAGG
jgi:uncharacterized protein (UPF0335 family)